MNPNIIKKGKTTALVAYFTIVGSFIAISMNSESRNQFARFHTRQAFGIHLLFIAFGILSSTYGDINSASALFLCYTVLWFYGFIGALQNKMQSIPLVGQFFQKWFTFIS